jgi:hypothetical protein
MPLMQTLCLLWVPPLPLPRALLVPLCPALRAALWSGLPTLASVVCPELCLLVSDRAQKRARGEIAPIVRPDKPPKSGPVQAYRK